MKHTFLICGLALGISLLTACGEPAVYSQESFAADSPFKLKVTSKAQTACESARRALLGQGYLIDSAKDETVRARKSYKNADNQNTVIEMSVVCVPERTGSTLFANGLMSTYDLKKSNASASVGVAAVGTISLPFGQSADSLVKVGEETIDDAEFYRRFFSAVTYTLGEMEPGDEPVGDPQTPPVAPQPEQALPASAPRPATVDGTVPTLPAPAPAQALPLPGPGPASAVTPGTLPPVQPATAPAATTAPMVPSSAPSAPVLGNVQTTAPQAGGAVVNAAPGPEAITAPATTTEAQPLPTAPAPAQSPAPLPESAPSTLPGAPALAQPVPTPQPQGTPSAPTTSVPAGGAPTQPVQEQLPATPADPASIFEETAPQQP